MKIPQDFKELLLEFARADVEYVLIGGYAVTYHCEPRATKDLDLLLAGSQENLGQAAVALGAFGLPMEVQALVRNMAETDVVYFGQVPLRVDLLRSIQGVDTQAVMLSAVRARVDTVDLRIISIDHLLANKRSVGRPQDLADVKRLEAVQQRLSKGHSD
jgi:predicted nucleotidyltransferase